jgi:hypothetical protein
MTWEKVRLENLCTIVEVVLQDLKVQDTMVMELMIEDLTRDGKYVTPQVDSLN